MINRSQLLNYYSLYYFDSKATAVSVRHAINDSPMTLQLDN